MSKLNITHLKKLEPQELIKSGILAYNNAQELVDEALILVGNFSYARAFVLSFTAFEEQSKAWFLCGLGHKIHFGVSKDKLDDDYKLTVRLFTSHKQKIQLGALISMYLDYYEKLAIQDEILNKTFDEIEIEEIPELVDKIKEVTYPLIDEFQNLEETDESEDGIAFLDRNRSLYVDIFTEKNELRISTPENIPRHIPLIALATITKYIDFMSSYFEIMEKFLEDDEKAIELLKSLISKEEINA